MALNVLALPQSGDMTSQNPFKRPLIKDVIIIFLDYVETYVDKPGAQAARREWESL